MKRHQDSRLNAKRIVYSWAAGDADGIGPVSDVASLDIACNAKSKPPALVGKARAGSNATFQWSNVSTAHSDTIKTL
jgi:hypothetical protein